MAWRGEGVATATFCAHACGALYVNLHVRAGVSTRATHTLTHTHYVCRTLQRHCAAQGHMPAPEAMAAVCEGEQGRRHVRDRKARDAAGALARNARRLTPIHSRIAIEASARKNKETQDFVGMSLCFSVVSREFYLNGGLEWHLSQSRFLFKPRKPSCVTDGVKQKARGKGVNLKVASGTPRKVSRGVDAKGRNSHCDVVVRTAPSALCWRGKVMFDRRSDQ